MRVDVRRAEPADVDAAVAIDPVTRRAAIQAAFRAGHGRIAVREGAIVAFAIVARQFFERPFVALLVVSASSRRRGIGRELLNAILREHAGSRVFTSTNESNAPMRRLLEALGFTSAGSIHGLDEGDPELVFYFDA
jgi:ribosomal protein S18 acetylase RimI-like enzyme